LVDLWGIGIKAPGATSAQKVAHEVVKLDSNGNPAEEVDKRWRQVLGPTTRTDNNNNMDYNPWWGRIWTSDKASCEYLNYPSPRTPTAITDWRGPFPTGTGCWEADPQGFIIPSERFASVVLVKPVTDDYMAQG
jgi:hypothetical protein